MERRVGGPCLGAMLLSTMHAQSGRLRQLWYQFPYSARGGLRTLVNGAGGGSGTQANAQLRVV
jgi:hypothetical protein